MANAMDVYKEALARSRAKDQDELVPGGNTGDASANTGKPGWSLAASLGQAYEAPANLIKGAAGAIEGIADFATMASMYAPLKIIDSIAGTEWLDAVKRLTEKSVTGSVADWLEREAFGGAIGTGMDEAQAFYDGRGKILSGAYNATREIEQGIGGMLPSVAASLVTGGALGLGQAAAEAASLTTLGLGAAGQSMQEAYQDGATVGRGLAYGAAEGAKEVVTEKLFDGAMEKIYGAGLLDPVVKSLGSGGAKPGALRTAGRLAKEFVGEGIEEGVGELIEPELKAIYKGADAYDGVTLLSRIKDAGRSFLMGGLTALAFSNTVGYGMAQAGMGYTGKEADAADILEDIQFQREKAENLIARGAAPDDAKLGKVEAKVRGLYTELETLLSGVKETERAKIVRDLSLEKAFSTDGKLSEEMYKMLNEESTIDRRYVSRDADERKVKEAAEKAGIQLAAGELTEQERAMWADVREAANQIREASGGAVTFALAESMPEDNGLYVGGEKVAFIGRDTLTSAEDAGAGAAGLSFRTLIHEVDHSLDGTIGRVMAQSLATEAENEAALEELIARGYLGDGMEAAKAELTRLSELDENASAEDLDKRDMILDEFMAINAENRLGTEHFFRSLIQRNASGAEKVLGGIRNVAEKLASLKSKTAREAYERMINQEDAFMAAVEQLGGEVVDGRIEGIMDRDDEDEETADGEDSVPRGDIRESIKRRAEIQQKSDAFREKAGNRALNEAVTDEIYDRASGDIETMASVMEPFLDILNNRGLRYLPEEVYGKSTLFSDSSYGGKSVENTSICYRTLAYNDFVDEVAKGIGRPLTVKESFLASQMLYQIAKDPQCLYCYVALDRKAYSEFLLKYIEQRDKAVSRYMALDDKGEKAKAALYKELLNGRKDTAPMRDRYYNWFRAAENGTEMITAEDLATSERRAQLMADGGVKAGQIVDAEKYAQSASWAKKQEEYRSYMSEILRMGKKMVNKLNGEYGLRFYSFSEFTAAFIVENMQQIRDASLKGLKGLAYTKEAEFARIFATTGMNINISTYGRMVNGEVVEDTKQGASWAEVQQLRKQYPNVGSVFVATNEALVEWALAQDWIDVVIPFHIVRTGADIAEFYRWTNFGGQQADVDTEGHNKTVTAAEHGNDKERFLSLCRERGIKPRFEKWIDNPGYMKLVNETRRSMDETQALVPTYNMDEALEAFQQFVEEGGYYGEWYDEGTDYKQAVERVVDDIKAKRSANEVEYGRQDIDIEEAMRRRTMKQHGREYMRRSRKKAGNPAAFDEAVKRSGITVEEGMDFDDRVMAETRAEAEERAAKAERTGRRAEATAEKNVTEAKADRAGIRPRPATVEMLNRRGAIEIYDKMDAREAVGRVVDLVKRALYEEGTPLSPGLEAYVKPTGVKQTERRVFEDLNSADSVYERRKAAERAAELLLNNTMVRTFYDQDTVMAAAGRVEILRGYMHKLSFEGLDGEIRYQYDDEAKAVARRWKARKGADAMRADAIAAELSERLGMNIDAEHPADIIRWINERYLTDTQIVNGAFKGFVQQTTAEEYDKLKDAISDEIMKQYDEGGRITSVSELMDVTTEMTRAAEARVKKLQERVENVVKTTADLRERDHWLNQAGYTAGRIRTWKRGDFEAASQIGNQSVLGVLGELGKINFRGNVSQTAISRVIGRVAEWYASDDVKRMLGAKEAKGALVDGGYWSGAVLEMMENIRDAKDVTAETAKQLCRVLDYFHKMTEEYNTVRIKGKRVNAKDAAGAYVDIIRGTARRERTSVIGRLMDVYFENYVDPMALMRWHDAYNKRGFFTTMLGELRAAEHNTDLLRRGMFKQVSDFLDENKGWYEAAQKKTVHIGTNKVPLMVGLYLELALRRDQAIPHLMKNGFRYWNDAIQKDVAVNGLMAVSNETTEAEMKAQAHSLAEEIYSQLDAADKEFVGLAYKLFNEDCKDLKRETDLRRLGFSNVEDGLYIPIRIAEQAVRVDTGEMRDEIDRATNASFNKATVDHAVNKIVAEDLYSVLTRHCDGIARYAGMSEFIEMFEQVLNVDVGDNPGDPNTVKKAIGDVWGKKRMKWFGGKVEIKGGVDYFVDMIQDVQKIPRKSDRMLLDGIVEYMRGRAAVAVLGANPKVLVTQFSSLFAATSILDGQYIIKGLGMKADGAEINKYCTLAELRDADDTAARAMTLVDKATTKIGEFSMALIGKMDRFVVTRCWNACLLQVAAEKHLAIDSEECKIAAGKLLTDVIYETQQNSQMTEKSEAMRSGSTVQKIVTMFSADSMKAIGRAIDGFGEVSVLKKKLSEAVTEEERRSIQAQLEEAQGRCRKAFGALLTGAAFMALVSTLFRKLLARDDDDTLNADGWSVGDVKTFFGDLLGSALGGMPIIKEVAEAFGSGYQLEEMGVGALNDLIAGVKTLARVCMGSITGETSSQEVARGLRTVCYAVSSAMGIPVKNVFKYLRAAGYYIAPDVIYQTDSIFNNKSYSSDLAKAIESGNERRAQMIAGVMINRKADFVESTAVRGELQRLATSGHAVLPQVPGASLTVDGQVYELGKRQAAAFDKVYAQADAAAERLIRSKAYAGCSDEVKAAAVKRVYSQYYNLATEEVLGVDLESKSVLMAKAIPAEKLAVIAAQASAIKSDVDAAGKVVSGSKKAKVQQFVQSLRMSAAQKYLVFAYLGYKNAGGEAEIRRYVQSLNCSAAEKKAILKVAGY